MLDGVRKCVLKMIYNNFDCVYRREVFWLVNRNVSNWIVFRDKSDILLDVCDSVVIYDDLDG